MVEGCNISASQGESISETLEKSDVNGNSVKEGFNSSIPREDVSVKVDLDRSGNDEYTSTVPITADGERPQKKFYRQRAHCNPLAHNDTFKYPFMPTEIDWTKDHYPNFNKADKVIETSCTANHGPSSLELSHVDVVQPTILDIGCGFGGLTLALASIVPNELVLGMEIRAKVTEYVRLRIVNARLEYQQQKQRQIISEDVTATSTENSNKRLLKQRQKNKKRYKIDPNAKIEHKTLSSMITDHTNNETLNGGTADAAATAGHHYENCSVIRTNSMKFLPNYFVPHSILKLFLCFPDPHFKRKNHPRRIITVRLLSIYAYMLQKGCGKLYCVTDVSELHEWHIAACHEHPLLELVTTGIIGPDDSISETNRVMENDPCIRAMLLETEESKKVTRNKGTKHYAVYRRISQDEEDKKPRINSTNFFAPS